MNRSARGASATVIAPSSKRRGGLRSRLRVLGALFTVTGLTALIQEQSFEKILGTLLGTSTPAAAVVLSTYFAGITLGAWWYARFLRGRIARPLRAYAVLEAGVAAWAALLYWFFDDLIPIFVPVLRLGMDAGWALPAARTAVALAWMLPPTLLMGATLPAVSDALGSFRLRNPGRAVAVFYSLNLLGAIAGALVGPYVLFGWIGLDRSLLAVAVAGFGVGATAWILGGESRGRLPGRPSAETKPSSIRRGFSLDERYLLLTAFLAGVCFFALEVLWVHLISVVFGNSIYSFATMLSVVLLGLFLGGQIVGWVLPGRRGITAFAPGLLMVAASLPLTLAHQVWPLVPHYLAVLGGDLTSFAAGEALKWCVAMALLLPTCTVLGIVFPVLFRVETRSPSDRIRLVGYLAAVNSVGCVLGALVTSFVLIPSLGSQSTHLAIVATYCLLGLSLVLAARPPRRLLRLALLFALACVAFAMSRSAWNPLALTSGENVYFRPYQVWPDSKLLFFHEDTLGGITTVVETPAREGAYSRPWRTLLTNGKFQGNDAWEADAQTGFALIPQLHIEAPKDALVIGFGTGHSAAVVHAMGFERIAVAELAPGILQGSRYFEHLNRNILEGSAAELHLEDGRNLILLDSRQYDLITIEITSIWFAGATNVYSREFYELARQRLRPGGVLQQWIQLHHLDLNEVQVALATIREVFPQVSLWVFGGQGIMVASEAPQVLRGSAFRRLISNAARLDWAPETLPGRLARLLGCRLLAPDDVTRMVSSVRSARAAESREWLNTDRNRRFEYSTPRFYLSRTPHREVNLSALARFASFPPFLSSGAETSEALTLLTKRWTPRWHHQALGLDELNAKAPIQDQQLSTDGR